MKLVCGYEVLAVLLVLLALSANCASALATDYTKIGVKVGNTADYKTSTDWGSYNKTHVLVYGVLLSGIVTLNITNYYPNGTIASKSQVILDLLIGGLASAYLIAANLTVADPIYAQTSMKINETVSMTIAGTPRAVNHLRLPDGSFEAYWDKATGLMTKLNWWFIGWLNMTMISTDAWSVAPPPPPPVTPKLTVKLSGEFDYAAYESVKVRLAALVTDAKTSIPVSDAIVLIEIYYPNGTLWISGKMVEKLAKTGIYEWESSDKIVKMKLAKGVYLTHVRAFLLNDPTASDMLLFHIDPPAETEGPALTTALYYAGSVIVLFAGIVGVFLMRRRMRLKVVTALD